MKRQIICLYCKSNRCKSHFVFHLVLWFSAECLIPHRHAVYAENVVYAVISLFNLSRKIRFLRPVTLFLSIFKACTQRLCVVTSCAVMNCLLWVSFYYVLVKWFPAHYCNEESEEEKSDLSSCLCLSVSFSFSFSFSLFHHHPPTTPHPTHHCVPFPQVMIWCR